ncbi:MAG: peptide deformylase [Candidatus Handelsmanbacteria bacterium RIFCSPLOWO2_12_FULL_64_10]|uniref:Peptide deformylase n=1 Tax=Handelsmanbacteria sp. (strain RIFCSPLOWO2_12_FULL_64_10) TaxID=1817868 RepID=A0A1F6CGP7_HANXR|nr:MAG: peptide deformylase [Candidatus Handelsmanbacteria bacterium RIFCSPLOWO2_12_FULL_64_10]
MTLLEIKKYGCPVLRRKAAPVTAFDEDLRTLVEDMFETMYEAEGVGLAGPQVGVLRRVIVLDLGAHDPNFQPIALINPEVVSVEGEIEGEEGCLSFPGLTGDVKRPSKARVCGFDVEGKPVEIETSEMGARAALHEIDHLDGVLFIDRVSALKRHLMRGALRKLQKEGEKQSQAKKVAEPKPVNSKP